MYLCTLKSVGPHAPKSHATSGSTMSNPLISTKKMKKYVCNICGYVYDPINGDPDSNIAPGTPFEKLPSDWVCPLCGVGKEDFSPVDE